MAKKSKNKKNQRSKTCKAKGYGWCIYNDNTVCETKYKDCPEFYFGSLINILYENDITVELEQLPMCYDNAKQLAHNIRTNNDKQLRYTADVIVVRDDVDAFVVHMFARHVSLSMNLKTWETRLNGQNQIHTIPYTAMVHILTSPDALVV